MSDIPENIKRTLNKIAFDDPVIKRVGPHAKNDAYHSGWRMGSLEATLRERKPDKWREMFLAGEFDQVDLIAMKFGYRTNKVYECRSWFQVEFVRE